MYGDVVAVEVITLFMGFMATRVEMNYKHGGLLHARMLYTLITSAS